jgi:hypothetical protein
MSGGAVISENEATGGGVGGGVYFDSSTRTFQMPGGTLSGNDASSGGGVFVDDGDFNIPVLSMAEIKGNGAGVAGGGVYFYSPTGTGTFNMSGGTIGGDTDAEANRAISRGGGVCVNAGNFEMSGGIISGNKATAGYGGGVYVENSGAFTLNGGTIGGDNPGENNFAQSFGGGVYVESGSFSMQTGTIIGNITAGNGGGVYVDSGGIFSKTGGIIYGSGHPSWNQARNGADDTFGHAAFYYKDSGNQYYRDATLNAGDDINTTLPLPVGSGDTVNRWTKK